MSRREGQLFVGRLSKNARTRDIEELFEHYGRLARCEIKYAYAFVDYEDRRDAEDAVRKANGKDVCGSSIVVEWAKGNPRQPLSYDECYKCHRTGHWARDCPDDPHGYRRRTPSPRRSSFRERRSSKRSRSRSRSRVRSSNRRRRSLSRSRSRSLPYKRPSRRSEKQSRSSSGDRSRSHRSRSRSRNSSKC